ncbi:MAG: proton-conducting transporter membrane subunit, partial [Oscillospiraceae bacterium]
MTNLLLLSMVFLPIFFAFLPLVFKDTKKLHALFTALCLGELISSLWLLASFNISEKIIACLPWFSGVGIYFKLNGLGAVLTVATCIVWTLASIFAKEYFEKKQQNLNRFYSFFSVSLSGTLGVFLGNDLLTVFIFFEIMSFAVYVLVVHNQDQEAIKAGNSYLTITVLGGLVSLLGIFLLNGLTHTLVLEELSSACVPFWGNPMLYVAGFMIFFGFAAKAGLFPLHGWLAKTYTAAPSPATIALSSILSKVGVYGMIIVCLKVMQSSYIWALFVLALSVCTMLVGGISALLSVNLKETLAYSSMSQIGFITVGISMCALLNEEGSVAAYGTVLH